MQKYILYLRKNSLKKLAKDKNIQKFRNIVNTRVNIEVQHIVFVI